jgi:hypothetical protein
MIITELQNFGFQYIFLSLCTYFLCKRGLYDCPYAFLLMLRHVAVARIAREHRFPITLSVRVRILLRLLPSNGHCLQSRYLATGQHATL